MAIICPLCGEEFSDVHVFAQHAQTHSEDEKRRVREEEQRRIDDQRKYDAAKLAKLREEYELALEKYSTAKEDYAKKYATNSQIFARIPWVFL